MNLESIVSSEMSQAWKEPDHMVLPMWKVQNQLSKENSEWYDEFWEYVDQNKNFN